MKRPKKTTTRDNAALKENGQAEKTNLIPFRIERNSKYHTISLLAVEDPCLSWAAKGVHTYLISRPDNWKLYYNDLLARSTNSRTALKSAIQNLKQCGYLTLEPIQCTDGRFNGWRWIIFEQAKEQTQAREKSKPS